MARVSIAGVGPVVASQEDALGGLTDIAIHMTSQGPVLLAVTRGGGYLTGYATGGTPGATAQQDAWEIPAGYLQLESTDLVVVPDGGSGDLLLVGMNSNAIQGLNLSGNALGNQFSGNADYSASGVDLGDITDLGLLPGGATGVAALRGGGLIQVSFGAGGSVSTQPVNTGTLEGTRASAIATAQHQGQNYAFVSYGNDDAITVLREGAGGQMVQLSAIAAGGGLWIDRPGALSTVEAADGKLYVIVASSGSGSLSVLELNHGTGQLTPVDHVLDSRDTRFDNASHVTAFEASGQDYILVAGADDGISLLAVLPGGRLQLIETIEGSAALPLNGITDIEVLVQGGDVRFWVATEAAPYLSEFSLSFDAPGTSALSAASGGALTGTGGDDTLSGQEGNDTLNGGAGDDLILDGAGADRMTGGSGADEFIFVEDGQRDIVLDFQPGIDKLDLTSFGVLGQGAQLTIIPRSWGAELRIGDEVFEIRSASGGTLTAADFEADSFVGLNRVSLEEIIIINPPPPPPPPPPSPDPPEATQLPGPPPEASGWVSPPAFLFPAAPAQGNNKPSLQNDHVSGSNGNDHILTLLGDDSINAQGGRDRVFAGGGDDLVFGGQGLDTLYGELGQDTLIGGDHGDLLGGGEGHDILLGQGGFDAIFGGAGNDVIWAGSSPDRAWGGQGDDWMSAGSNHGFSVDGMWGEGGNDTMFGNTGFDFLDGGPGNDLMDGGDQADNLYGGDGNDTLFGGQGLDRLFGDDGNDICYGGSGNDGLFGLRGDDTLWGGDGNDRFFGGIGNDILDGGSDSDTIYAGAGFDTLIGGTGNDRLFGNFNADRFVFADGHGDDVIVDFDANNIYEKIDLTGISAITSLSDLLANHATQVGGTVVIDTGGGNSITLLGVSLSALDESDFLF